jgi:hypothetical protein
MALCKSKSASGGFFVEAVLIIYFIFSLLWLASALFQAVIGDRVETTLYPAINALIAILVCTGWVVNLMLRAIDDAGEAYGKMDSEEKEKVDEFGKKLGTALFSLLKERKGWLGELCRKIDKE